jgi:drug/metabolite transporter (DMT)-like permease
VIAILGGLGAASMWGVTTLCSARSSRLIGPSAVLAWVMLVGLAVTVPWAVASGLPDDLDAELAGWLALGGVGNVAGLLFEYGALRIGKVGIVAPIASTEGAIAAAIAIAAGESVSPGVGAALMVVVGGVALSGLAEDEEGAARPGDPKRSVALAVASAVCFGVGLYAAGRVSDEVSAAWVVLPARVVGTFAVALPLALSSRLVLTRRAAPLVVAAGLCEVGGFAAFAVGARHGVAVTSILASQFAVVAGVAAYALFHERLGRIQLAGVVAVVAGVAALSGLQA